MLRSNVMKMVISWKLRAYTPGITQVFLHWSTQSCDSFKSNKWIRLTGLSWRNQVFHKVKRGIQKIREQVYRICISIDKTKVYLLQTSCGLYGRLDMNNNLIVVLQNKQCWSKAEYRSSRSNPLKSLCRRIHFRTVWPKICGLKWDMRCVLDSENPQVRLLAPYQSMYLRITHVKPWGTKSTEASASCFERHKR